MEDQGCFRESFYIQKQFELVREKAMDDSNNPLICRSYGLKSLFLQREIDCIFEQVYEMCGVKKKP